MRRRTTAPYVHLDEERVRTRAYYLWRDQSGKGWTNAASNWFEASAFEAETCAREQLVKFPHPEFRGTSACVYDLVACFEGSLDRPESKVHLGSKADRRCSICLRRVPETTFQKDAHVIPQALANRSLLTWDECDQCNEAMGKMENDLARLVGLERAFAGIRIQRGRAKYKPLINGRPSQVQKVGVGLEVTVHPDDSAMAGPSCPLTPRT